jgi:hypothetical protein
MSFELISTGLDILGVVLLWLVSNYLMWEILGKRLRISIETRESKTVVLYGEKK